VRSQAPEVERFSAASPDRERRPPCREYRALVNYMDGSFVAVADGDTLVTEAQTERQPLLAHPLHG
jgi:hypothetical protein